MIRAFIDCQGAIVRSVALGHESLAKIRSPLICLGLWDE